MKWIVKIRLFSLGSFYDEKIRLFPGNPEDKKDSDEMINKILSRNSEEFDRFIKMDE